MAGVPIFRLLIHDWTKLLPCEWFAYAENFYGTKKSGEIVKDRFNAAWLHHIHWNKHHWNYYVLVNEDGSRVAIPMPEKYVREMVADWFGAGRAIMHSWDISDWWEKHKSGIILHPQTQIRVEQLLGMKVEK